MDFSFLIPVYNCRHTLRSCVECILASGLSSIEILLIDDGSTDGSFGLCDALSKEDSRIRVIHQPNSGVSAARNAGLHAAKGEYILFADADDTMDSAELAHILSDPRCRQADLTIFGLTFDYYRNGRCYRRDSMTCEKNGLFSPGMWERELPALYECNALTPVWNKIYRRTLLQDNQLCFPEDMFLYEDLTFVLSCLSCCSHVFTVPKTVYHYRQTEDEGNAGRRLSRIPSIPKLVDRVEDAFENLRRTHPGVPREDCEEILQKLHLTLAREKIAVSCTEEIRNICREYAGWERSRISAPQPSRFREQLLKNQVFFLLLHRFRTKLRHHLAVAVKSRCTQGGF